MPNRTAKGMLGLIGLVAVGCSGDDTGPAPLTGSLQVIQAAESTATIDVLVDGNVVIHRLAAGATSSAVAIPAGRREIAFRPVGGAASPHALDLAVSPDRAYTTVVTDSAAVLDPMVLSDTGSTPAAGRTKLQVANFSTLATLGGTQTIIPSIAKAVSALSLYDQTAYGGAFRLGSEPSLGNNRSVAEENRGGYAQADFRTEVGDWGLRGNFGVRYVKTKQYATGYTYVGGAPVAISSGREYDDTLPSMNLVLEPTDSFLIRFGAAKVMSRPDLGSLTPGSTVSVSGTARSVTAGNPNLDPFRAKTFDLAFEWYFQSQALLSLALFQKNIDSLVQTVTTSTTFTGNPFGIPDSVAIAACGTTVGCSPSAQWNFSTPVNTDGGKVKGFEVNYQQPFKFLPSFLANTGVLLNYTYVKSDVKYVNSAGAVVASTDLTGLSRNGYNATLYYEDAKWSARVSASYRDRYLTRVLGQENTTAAPIPYDGTNETFNVDASVQYTLNDQFKITLEGVNLTDEYQDQFTGTQNMPVVYHHTGREILLGLRYKF